MRKALSLFYLCTEIITFPLKGRLSSFIVSGKFPYRVKFYTKIFILRNDAHAIQEVSGERSEPVSLNPRAKGASPLKKPSAVGQRAFFI